MWDKAICTRKIENLSSITVDTRFENSETGQSFTRTDWEVSGIEQYKKRCDAELAQANLIATSKSEIAKDADIALVDPPEPSDFQKWVLKLVRLRKLINGREIEALPSSLDSEIAKLQSELQSEYQSGFELIAPL